jgi:hypothetical protein
MRVKENERNMKNIIGVGMKVYLWLSADRADTRTETNGCMSISITNSTELLLWKCIWMFGVHPESMEKYRDEWL